jgi:hypothetical protein
MKFPRTLTAGILAILLLFSSAFGKPHKASADCWYSPDVVNEQTTAC